RCDTSSVHQFIYMTRDALTRITTVDRPLAVHAPLPIHPPPAAYVRERRLAAVHAALQRGDARSVTDVLIAHGIHGFGHFAKAYARRYGHAPSVTARQPR
ncbi:helix-turn-helix domain-containing protein, partial [Burkholderia sp. Ac-20345]|uniref:helix-turn-helix domain-containing protein n=1 Tax=Burkholderia sp. Ac-20345 TaxID=2703891 RepID=UPI001F1216ED